MTTVLIRERQGDSLVVQWLGLLAFSAKGVGSISGQGTKILPACSAAKRKKKRERERERQREIWEAEIE